jgi:uncharacterized repeat protein (TIGR03803 family)
MKYKRKSVVLLLCCGATLSGAFAQTLTTIARFDGADGSDPYGPLVQGLDGSLYGTTWQGGANAICDLTCGTVYKVSPGGVLTNLHSFAGTDGFSPWAGLVQASGGVFYGTTYFGGSGFGETGNCESNFGCGTFFRITSKGDLTSLYSFDLTAYYPKGGVVEGADGNFYGITFNSDEGYGVGTVFRIMAGGVMTVLHSFTSTDGAFPYAPLIQGMDGNFYGTTLMGGTSDVGTVFKITPAGALTTLYSFGNDGIEPQAALVQGSDGNFYGTTSQGGAYAYGTIFKMAPDGTFTTLYSFPGNYAANALVEGSDGNFYGTTGSTVFRITPAGVFTTLYTFPADSYIQAALMQSTNGTFYGTTTGYGGTVFALSVGLGPFVKSRPTFGSRGSSVAILGTDLTGAIQVTFDGKPSAFTVVSGSEILATVPSGAETGIIQVTSPSAVLSGDRPFVVVPGPK